jgi:hypothetical protein
MKFAKFIFFVVCAVFALSTTTTPASAQPTDGDVQVLVEQLQALGRKAGVQQQKIDELKQLVEKCHADGCVEEPTVKPKTRRNNTKTHVKYVVKSWKLSDEDKQGLLDAIDALWAKIESRFDKVDGDHEKILANQRKILAHVRDLSQAGKCLQIPKYASELPKSIQGALAASIKDYINACELNKTKFMLACVQTGSRCFSTSGFAMTEPSNGSLLQTRKLKLLDEHSTLTADVLMGMLPLFSGLAGYGVGDLVQQNQLDTENGTFFESHGGQGLLIGVGAGALATIIYFLVRPSAEDRASEQLAREGFMIRSGFAGGDVRLMPTAMPGGGGLTLSGSFH